MKLEARQLIGKKVFDKDLSELGKIYDFAIDIENWSITDLFVSTGLLRHKDEFKISLDDVSELGDKIFLKIDKAEIEKRENL
jgi:sporulation protein YlmC with PRC-barrel domain